MLNQRIPQIFTLIHFYVDPGSTLLVRPIKRETLDNQLITKGLKYPDPHLKYINWEQSY